MKNRGLRRHCSKFITGMFCLIHVMVFADSASALKQISDDGRPWAIYYWVNGLVDNPGITQDVKAAAEAGLGGFLLMDVALPGIPDSGPSFNSPQWRGLLKHAADEIVGNDMSLAMPSAAGWSGMGGPWVPDEYAMKELTWSVTVVQGQGRAEALALPQPETRSGLYRDIAVLAVPGKGAENIANRVTLLPTGTLAENEFRKLCDGSVAVDVKITPQTRIDVRIPDGISGPGALRFRMPRLNYDRAGGVSCAVYSSADGQSWTLLKSVNLRWCFSAPESAKKTLRDSITVALPDNTGPFLRLTFPRELPLAELEFLTGSHIDYLEAKAALVMDRAHDAGFPQITSLTASGSRGALVSSEDILNLTDRMKSPGILDWQVPQGDWRIFRFGYTLTGRKKGVIRKGGEGWAVDAMSRSASVRHLDSYAKTLVERGGPAYGKLQILHSDSWEEFFQNWTEGFADRFRELRGYDLLAFLPVVTGEVLVDSTEVSERFLWDFRRTLADLMIKNHFGALRDWAHENNLLFHADNAGRQQWLSDPVRFQMAADIPGGEFWLFQNDVRPDIKTAASAAHVSGRNLVSGEAFTDTGSNDGWRTCPSRLKSLGDRAFCEGVNLFIFHTYTAQPDQMPPPGVTLGKWGTMYSRHRLWWKEFAPEWHAYLRRCSEQLRKGQYCADVLLVASDGAPSETGNAAAFPVPSGYGFDLGDSGLLSTAEVDGNEIVLPSGMRYRLVAFLSAEQRPSTLQAVERLVNAGAAVLGSCPVRAPGLENFPASDRQVKKLSAQIWPQDGQNIRTVGNGTVFSGLTVQETLQRLQVLPQFESDQSELHFIRRNTSEGPVYFVANSSEKTVEAFCRFRVGSGYTPMLYDPVSDRRSPVPSYRTDGKTVEIPLRFDSLDSVFVCFAKEAGLYPELKMTRNGAPFNCFHPVTARTSAGLLSVSAGSSGWQVAQKDNASYVVSGGADASGLRVDKIVESSLSNPWKLEFVSPAGDEPPVQNGAVPGDWSKSRDEKVRYFSGTGIYQTVFSCTGGHVVLDLGTVCDQAAVYVNGQLAGRLWKPPFRIDISEYVHAGPNTLRVEVVNSWLNRLIGEERFPTDIKYGSDGMMTMASLPEWVRNPDIKRPGQRKTFATHRHVKSDSPLAPSGLIGPIRIEQTMQ
jgi:hypothetical protein